MKYRDGIDVHIGDHILLSAAKAVVETVIDGDDLADWGLEEPGFMILCHGDRFLIEPGSASWEDVGFIGRGTQPHV